MLALPEHVAKTLDIENEVTRKDLFEKYMSKANDTLRTEELNNVSRTIEKYLKEQINSQEAENVSFDFRLQDIWSQYKYLELSMTHNELNLPASRLGHGFQSLIVIAIFRAYQELKNINENTIFLMEEPEMFLHTHAKKYFYSVLKNIADSGSQIIYSTHASEFVNILDHKNVKRITLEEGITSIYSETGDLSFHEDELLKLNTAINNERGELFFAEKVILVEGDTEKVVYDYLLKLAEYDPNLFNISIIETSGKGSMYRYIQLLQSLNIPFVVVYDSDILEEGEDQEQNKKIKENNNDAIKKNTRIQEVTENEEVLFELDPYFEVVANMKSNKQKKTDSKPINAIKYFQKFKTITEIKEELPEIIAPIEKLLDKNFTPESSPQPDPSPQPESFDLPF